MATKARTKAAATPAAVPQSDAEAGGMVARIGFLHTLIEAEQAALNERIRAATVEAAARMAPWQRETDDLTQGLATWAAAHRARLLAGGGKTVRLSGGLIGWRLRPPRVTIRDAAAVLARLIEGGLGNLVRVKREIDKEAILANPRAVEGIEGIAVGSAGEDFFVEPHAIDVKAAPAGGGDGPA